MSAYLSDAAYWQREAQLARDTIAAKDAEIAALREVLRLFTGSAYPTAIDPRGYAWSEAYLDQALAVARTQQGRRDD